MIDWVTVLFDDVYADLPCNTVVEFKPDGSEVFRIEKGISLEKGSFEASMFVRNTARGLHISGNPSKWLQGHNLFGVDDWHVVDDCLNDIKKRLGVVATVYRVKRIDITYNFKTKDVDGYLNALSQHASGKRQGVTRRGTTVYFGQFSKRSVVKFYNKETEVKKHGFPIDFNKHQKMVLDSYAVDLLRVEVMLRGKALDDLFGSRYITKNGKKTLNQIDWYKVDFRTLWEKKIMDCNIPNAIELKEYDFKNLKPRLKLVYRAWSDGEDVKAMFTKPTFYRMRAELMNHGIDISNRAPASHGAKIIPLFRVLEAIPAMIPQVAYHLRLVA